MGKETGAGNSKIDEDHALLEKFIARAICDANIERAQQYKNKIHLMKKIPLNELSVKADKGEPVALYVLGAFLKLQDNNQEERQRGLLYIEAAASMGVPQAQLALAAHHVAMAATYGFYLPRVLVETIKKWEKEQGGLDHVIAFGGTPLREGPVRNQSAVAKPPKPLDKNHG
ncbi:MAG: hypothetical protein WC612_08590 [Bdellovibrionales bacterium]|jgi:TPR repeat protein